MSKAERFPSAFHSLKILFETSFSGCWLFFRQLENLFELTIYTFCYGKLQSNFKTLNVKVLSRKLFLFRSRAESSQFARVWKRKIPNLNSKTSDRTFSKKIMKINIHKSYLQACRPTLQKVFTKLQPQKQISSSFLIQTMRIHILKKQNCLCRNILLVSSSDFLLFSSKIEISQVVWTLKIKVNKLRVIYYFACMIQNESVYVFKTQTFWKNLTFHSISISISYGWIPNLIIF